MAGDLSNKTGRLSAHILERNVSNTYSMHVWVSWCRCWCCEPLKACSVSSLYTDSILTRFLYYFRWLCWYFLLSPRLMCTCVQTYVFLVDTCNQLTFYLFLLRPSGNFALPHCFTGFLACFRWIHNSFNCTTHINRACVYSGSFYLKWCNRFTIGQSYTTSMFWSSEHNIGLSKDNIILEQVGLVNLVNPGLTAETRWYWVFY